MAKEKNIESVFNTLNSINVNDHTEKKKTGSSELTYLSWSWGWSEVKKRYPDATYTIYKDEYNRPYIEDPDFGLMCYTTVTIEGQTHEMWLPVMDGANKAMKRTPYSYKVWNRYDKKWEDKQVAAATMFDINKTIMRCLVKNLAMFGLGLYIYAGEDLPEEPVQDAAPAAPAKAPSQAKPKQAATGPQAPQDDLFGKPSQEELEEAFQMILTDINGATDIESLKRMHGQVPGLHDYKKYKDAMNKRYKELQK